jgi:hypothetical protein
MFGKACHSKFHNAFVDASGDEQFANSSPPGSSQLVFAILAYLAAHPEFAALKAAHPEFAALKLDVKNAFQEAIRALILEVYWETPSLRSLHCYMYHLLSTRALVFLGSGSSMILCIFNSGEGSQQGCVFGMPNFNILIAAVNRKTAVLLQAHKGNLFAGVLYNISNDHHVPGLKTLGLEVAVHKSQTWIALEHRTPEYQEFPGQIPQESLPFTNEDGTESRALGFTVWGVPIGDDQYIKAFLTAHVSSFQRDLKMQRLLDPNRAATEFMALRQCLRVLILRCIQFQSSYLARHVPVKFVLPFKP